MARRSELRVGERVEYSPYPRAWETAKITALGARKATMKVESYGQTVTVGYNKIHKLKSKPAAASARPKGLDDDLQQAMDEWEGSLLDTDHVEAILKQRYGARLTPAIHADELDNIATWFEAHAAETKDDDDPGVPATYLYYASDLRTSANHMRGVPKGQRRPKKKRAPARKKPTVGSARSALRQSVRKDK